MSLRDTFHEWRIRFARRAVEAAIRGDEPPVVVRYRWYRLASLINARSPEQIARMERRMGLR